MWYCRDMAQSREVPTPSGPPMRQEAAPSTRPKAEGNAPQAAGPPITEETVRTKAKGLLVEFAQLRSKDEVNTILTEEIPASRANLVVAVQTWLATAFETRGIDQAAVKVNSLKLIPPNQTVIMPPLLFNPINWTMADHKLCPNARMILVDAWHANCKSFSDRMLVWVQELFAFVTANALVPKASFLEGMAAVLEELHDTAVDVPFAPKLVRSTFQP